MSQISSFWLDDVKAGGTKKDTVLVALNLLFVACTALRVRWNCPGSDACHISRSVLLSLKNTTWDNLSIVRWTFTPKIKAKARNYAQFCHWKRGVDKLEGVHLWRHSKQDEVGGESCLELGVRPELLSSPNTDVMLRKAGPVLVTQRQEHRPCEVDLKPRTAFTLSHQTASLNNSNYTIVAPTKAAWKIKPRTNWERSFFHAASIVLLKGCTQDLNLQFHPNIFSYDVISSAK